MKIFRSKWNHVATLILEWDESGPHRHDTWRSKGYLYTGSSVAGHPGHYDFLNGVAFGHKELWQTLVADSLAVTTQMLWHLATTNYGV